MSGTKERWGQRCWPCPAAALRRRKAARVKDEGWWCPGTCTAQVGASCHLPAVISVLSRARFTPVSQSIPEKGNSRSRATLCEGQCHVWSSPSPPGIPRRAARLPRPWCSRSCQLGVRVSVLPGGGSGCQALQPASLTALITCLREYGQEGAGGDSCVPAQLLRALVESHIHPSGCH